jgi:predicted amidophosphoribosyltransferase
MVCPQCHGETKPGAKFCSECGTKLPAVCPQCGTQLTPNAKCRGCG